MYLKKYIGIWILFDVFPQMNKDYLNHKSKKGSIKCWKYIRWMMEWIIQCYESRLLLSCCFSSLNKIHWTTLIFLPVHTNHNTQLQQFILQQLQQNVNFEVAEDLVYITQLWLSFIVSHSFVCKVITILALVTAHEPLTWKTCWL